MELNQKQVSLWQKFEIAINTVNHCLIGITTFYTVWYCLKYNFTDKLTLHAYLTTFGYQVLMAEAIMSYYKSNTYTLFTPKMKKSRIHWIMQSIGALMAIIGTIIEIINRYEMKRTHFSTLHSVYGLISVIFLFFSLTSGCSALFSYELRNYLKPPLNRIAHILFSLITFVTGMISLVYVWFEKTWAKRYDPGNLRYFMGYAIIVITALSILGVLQTLASLIIRYYKSTQSKNKQPDYEA